MIISPWGEILAEAENGDGVITATVDIKNYCCAAPSHHSIVQQNLLTPNYTAASKTSLLPALDYARPCHQWLDIYFDGRQLAPPSCQPMI